MKVSIIVTTYNWPEALDRVLDSISNQQQSPYEVLVADDGSGAATKQLIASYKDKLPLIHIWQEDLGFRAARCRNLAIKAASGDYVIFIDGDCVLPVDFVKRHINLSQQGYFVAGNRILLDKNFSSRVLDKKLNVGKFNTFDWIRCKFKGSVNKLFPTLRLPLGPLRKFKANSWKRAKTCNLGVWLSDLLLVNGFDESFNGWGYEDSDLVIRLLRSGKKRKLGKFSTPVFHLWHKLVSRDNEAKNKQMFHNILNSNKIEAKIGLNAQ